jgi:hypothetical protein
MKVLIPTVIAACSASQAAAQSCLWAEGPGMEIPSSRYGEAMTFDSARGRTVLFGGRSSGEIFGDTWEWDGITWLFRANSGPSDGNGSTLGYDVGRARTVLYEVFTGGTWEWDGLVWTLAGSGPTHGSPLFFDTHHHTLSMLRYAATGCQLWDWNGSAWTQRAVGAGLPTGGGRIAAFDSGRNRIVVYLVSGADPGQTWEFDNAAGTWSQIPASGPPGQGAFLVYDSVNARTIFYTMRETWEWNGSVWKLTSNTGPGPFLSPSAAFDSIRGRMVLVGRGFETIANQTWEYNAGATNAGVVITQQPESMSITPGETAIFHIAARGAGPVAIRWRRNGQPLQDGGNVSGSQTGTLTIGPVARADEGIIEALLTDACGPVLSQRGNLGVFVPCWVNCDGSVLAPMLNAGDFQCFLNTYAAGCPADPTQCWANCDQSTSPPVLNVNDFQCFMNHFAIGCP